MGHAINKVFVNKEFLTEYSFILIFRNCFRFIQVLKDVTLRSKIITGKRVHYVPGWDCHGLPIEQKVLSDTKDDSPLEIRRKGMLSNMNIARYSILKSILLKNSLYYSQKIRKRRYSETKTSFYIVGHYSRLERIGMLFHKSHLVREEPDATIYKSV